MCYLLIGNVLYIVTYLKTKPIMKNSNLADRVLSLSSINEGVLWGRHSECEAHKSSVKFLNNTEQFSLPIHYNNAKHDAIKLILNFLFSFYIFDYIGLVLNGDKLNVTLYKNKD